MGRGVAAGKQLQHGGGAQRSQRAQRRLFFFVLAADWADGAGRMRFAGRVWPPRLRAVTVAAVGNDNTADDQT